MEDWCAFDQAVGCLPRELRLAVLALPQETRSLCEEIHLRAGRQLCWSDGGGEYPVLVGDRPVTVSGEDLRMMVELATRSSYHAVSDQLRRGFLTLPGGHRLGLSGTAVTGGGEITGFRQLSSLNLRIARAKGEAGGILSQLMENGRFQSTLVLSPPGKGKTTLLRELVRLLSDGSARQRVGLVDERGEVAAMVNGVPQLNVGQHTDVLEGGSKAEGMLMMLRTMDPQVLAVDEITAPADVAALSMAANCGVSLLATAHAHQREELSQRPLYRQVMEEKMFQKLVWITVNQGMRHYQVEDVP